MGVEEKTFEIERIKNSRLPEIDFGKLQFGRVFSDHMFLAEYENGTWNSAKIMPYGDIPFSPASCVFHYGQAIFEGLKAYKAESGEVLLFRPDENCKRLNRSAERMCMPNVPESIFIEGIRQLVALDKAWVPDEEGKALYVRPFLIADEEFLGVKPSSKYKFMIITSPTAGYYSGAVDVKVETKYSRACLGGIGAAKAAANYATSLYPATQAQKEGFHQLVWTDSETHTYIEESGTMNIMFIIDGKLITPSIERDTILQGITRASVVELARAWGMQVEERRISVKEVSEAIENNTLEEAFGVGTAATIAPFNSIGIEEVKHQLSDFNTWSFAMKAKNYLEELKRGEQVDEFNWTLKV